ncbi:hypothetical protein [Halovivax gelatinilyticus]|uniref:hypothetical protein n=1 Tax=Halovivax gelatinilyticus TaxID=2961597 RepID=UPI0020CA41D0|nr:hypothetical protein [Halovivax gelatinilyticus]
MTDDFADRLDEAESTIESFTDSGIGEVLGEASDEGTIESIREDVEAIVTILTETGDVLESIEISELPDAVDASQLREAIQTGEIPDALDDEDDANVVKLRQVIRSIDLGRTLSSIDLTDLWDSVREIDDATDELADEDDGMLDGEEMVGDDEDDGLFDDDDELVETDVDDVADVAAEEMKEKVDIESGNLGAYQEVIQAKAIDGIDEFRDGLLRTHGAFERVVEENRERMRRQDTQPNSRNPTAVSTISSGRRDVASVPNYATMPRTVRHSDAPTRTHIYGDRFRRERERRGYD